MKCPRCTGLLIKEDIREQSGRFQGWRCIQCGFRLDPLIVQNRTSAPPNLPNDDVEDTTPQAGRVVPRLLSRRTKRTAGKA